MQLKSIFGKCMKEHECEEKITRNASERKGKIGRGRSYIAPETSPQSPFIEQSQWVNLPHELLLDIFTRLEASETTWPARRTIVACASVCKSWREIVKEIIRTPEQCGLLTFPMSLKQPGPRNSQIQCFIKRESATSIYKLYLGLSPALSGVSSKSLMAAKKVRKATNTEFLISLTADDFSRTGGKYIGKLRSNFFGTKFSIYDTEPPCISTIKSSNWSLLNIFPKKIPSLRDYNVATLSYELNVLRTRGPRRMQCNLHTIPNSAIQEGGVAPTPPTFSTPISLPEPVGPTWDSGGSVVLRNKAPRWHEQLQCWCLNFKGRVTVASVKNFQLEGDFDLLDNVPSREHDRVILQFGKMGKDIFTMDYSYPLSAFQAFAICLSSFDTKPACE